MANSSDQIAGQIAPAGAFNALRDDAFNDTAGGHDHLGTSTGGRLLVLSQVAAGDTVPFFVSRGGTGSTAFTAFEVVLTSTNSTGALISSTGGTTGFFLQYRGTAARPIFAEVTATVQSTIVSAARTAAAGTGDQSITGSGFTPTAVIILAADNGTVLGSWGFGDDGLNEKGMLLTNATVFNPTVDHIISIDFGATDSMIAVLKTLDADGMTLTWTKANSGVDVDFQVMFLR